MGEVLGAAFRVKLAETYGGLSAQLRRAADYAASHPLDIASRSLRSVARDSGLSPSTFSRMAKALGYASFEDLREEMRRALSAAPDSFSARAGRLQETHGELGDGFAEAHKAACISNIDRLFDDIDPADLSMIVDRLHHAERVVLVGSLGSTAIVEHMAYMANFFRQGWHLAGRAGASLGSALVDLGPQDALILVSKPPFAARGLRAVDQAAEQGVYVLVITDSPVCPAISRAAAHLIVPTDSPHFFSSYTATLALAETLIGMLATRGGAQATARIAAVEERNRRLEEVWDV